jgi:hypothetical protein
MYLLQSVIQDDMEYFYITNNQIMNNILSEEVYESSGVTKNQPFALLFS